MKIQINLPFIPKSKPEIMLTIEGEKKKVTAKKMKPQTLPTPKTKTTKDPYLRHVQV